MPDLWQDRMGRAFGTLIQNLFTRLSTALVDNPRQPSKHKG